MKKFKSSGVYSSYQLSEIQEPHPQPPPISKVSPFLPPVAGGLRGVRGGGYDAILFSMFAVKILLMLRKNK